MKCTRLRVRAIAPLLALGMMVVAPFESRRAEASVAIAVTFHDLIANSAAAALVTPSEATAVWENGRIFTYTHVNVDRAIAGSLTTGADAWVRTRGGVVGKIGQVVEGEALLAVGQQTLLFLHEGPAGSFDVTERGQGQFRVVSDDPKQPPHIFRNPGAGMIVAPNLPSPQLPQALAADVMHGLTVEDAARQVASAWVQFHAR